MYVCSWTTHSRKMLEAELLIERQNKTTQLEEHYAMQIWPILFITTTNMCPTHPPTHHHHHAKNQKSSCFVFFLSMLRPAQPVSVLLSVTLLRSSGHPVYSSVCGFLPAGVRLQHWTVLRAAFWGCQEGLFWEAVSGTFTQAKKTLLLQNKLTGRLLIARLVVWSLAAPSLYAKYPWSRY